MYLHIVWGFTKPRIKYFDGNPVSVHSWGDHRCISFSGWEIQSAFQHTISLRFISILKRMWLSSVQWLGYRLDDPGRSSEISSIFQKFQTCCGAHPGLHSKDKLIFSPEVKRQRRDVLLTPPFVEVKNKWSRTASPPTWLHVKDGKNVPFIILISSSHLFLSLRISLLLFKCSVQTVWTSIFSLIL